jgi:hypothetical protein
VAGCGWYRWKEEISAVRMVLDRVWQWQYWRCGGRLKNWTFSGARAGRRRRRAHCGCRGGQGSGSGGVRVVPLERGDQCGSNGTRYRVAVAVLAVWRSVEELDFFRGRGGTTSTARALWVPGAGERVAVAGCGWYRWKEGIGAVIFIPVGVWQWQYWRCGGRLKKKKKARNKKVAVAVYRDTWRHVYIVWPIKRQWLGGSGTVGKRISMRFERYQFHHGSGGGRPAKIDANSIPNKKKR